MRFAFIHPEFFFWMLLPVTALFFFWITQKPIENRWLRDEVLERLRAKEMTMGLKGRNGLFAFAAVLLIAAMAQPVLIPHNILYLPKASVLIVVDLTAKNQETFFRNRSLADQVLEAMRGRECALAAYEHERLYRISPLSTQYPLEHELLAGLGYAGPVATWDVATALRSSKGAGGMDAVVVVSSKKASVDASDGLIMYVEKVDDVKEIAAILTKKERDKRSMAYIPLFYYPLGLAMVLIVFAMSSMSKRQSVPLLLVLFLALPMGAAPSNAGILDFRLLAEAKEAYETGDFTRSERLYARYQRIHDGPEIRYNRANAFYRMGQYERARYWYSQVRTRNGELEAKARFNLILAEQKIRTLQKSSASSPAQEIFAGMVPSAAVRSGLLVERNQTVLFEYY